ncbi:MAG: hypothetical protein AAF489_13020 [Bacteroidota bacterium]
MKYLKQLNTVIIITMFMLTSYTSHSQEITPEGYSLEIPAAVKMSSSEAKNYELITTSHYDTKLAGYVYVSGIIDANGNVKFHSIYAPKRPVQSREGSGCTGGNYNACARSCTDRPTTAGVILCTSYCIIDCIIFED